VIPISSLFEAHLAVSDLNQSTIFYRDRLGLELAHSSSRPSAAFFWIGGRGDAMLGLWESGSMPLRMTNHVAFRVELEDLLEAPARLNGMGIIPRGFDGAPSDDAVVLAWMPAASVYFLDPDGNQLEFICMLPEPPKPELGVLAWSDWRNRKLQQAPR
jgi:lactoylglutathione lyase